MNLIGSLLVVLAVAVCSCTATTCKECKSAYDAENSTCTVAKDYISCLSTASGEECDTMLTKMAEAESARANETACVVTDTCQCEIEYHSTNVTAEADKCVALKMELKCLFTTTDLDCNGSTTAVGKHSEVKTAALALTNCYNGTACQCENDKEMANTSTDGLMCTELKKQLKCLFTATGMSCNNTGTVAVERDAVKAAAVAITADCFTNTACECEEARTAAAKDTAAQNCQAHRAEQQCLWSASGGSCDGTQTLTQVVTAQYTTMIAISNCSESTATCLCQIVFGKAARSTDTEKCTAYKAELGCFNGANFTAPCSGSTPAQNMTAATVTVADGLAGCLTDTCKCEAAFYTKDMSTTDKICTAIEEAETCSKAVTDASETSCGGSLTNTQLDTWLVAKRVSTACSSTGGLVMSVGLLAIMLLVSTFIH